MATIDDLVRPMPPSRTTTSGPEPLLSREWLVTNGLGGYASGTVSGVCTRRYHGLLIAALPAPLGRVVMLNHLAERVELADGTVLRLGGREHPDRLKVHPAEALKEFRLEAGMPVWIYQAGEVLLEKRIDLVHQQNTAHISYRVLSGDRRVRLRIRPSMNVRHHEAPVSQPLALPYTLRVQDDRYEIHAGEDVPALRMYVWGEDHSLVLSSRTRRNLYYRIEAERGYPEIGDLWSPGSFRIDLRDDRPTTLTVSVESWPAILALPPAEAIESERRRRQQLVDLAHPLAREGQAAELVLAADQFLIKPAGRVEDEARAQAAGGETRTIIAGYHWFTDWGRDTMISLEGLTLATGRHVEAGDILRTFAHYIRDGLIPNMFPEGELGGLYHTADATMWFFHAIDRYIHVTGDRGILRNLLPRLLEVVDHHVKGTRFGIGVDPADGLLRQGAEGYQLTWMDAKVDGWVVTPRRGKAVEINALWYNALRLLEGWLREEGMELRAAECAERAGRVRESFHRRFWYEEGGYLYDVIDGEDGRDDPACRPNQLLSISPRHPVLDPSRWRSVLETVRTRLLTPVGLRSLAPGHPDYKTNYDGDLRARDAAYHQGTVWAWLIGPYVDAWLKAYPDDRAGARAALDGFATHLGEAGIGTISEIFDAEPPFTPRGCIAQAWSVAEVLRCLILTSDRSSS